jgi:DNA-binding NtrC family response regulator
MRHYDWPGNVRELENMVQQALALTESRIIDSQDLPMGRNAMQIHGRPTFQQSKAAAISQFERQYVSELLHAHHGNVTQASRAVGKERRSLGRLIKKYQLKCECAPEPLGHF